MIHLRGRKSAFNLQKALWALIETGQTFERTDMGGDFGGLTDAAFLALNPNGRIPVLEDEGFVLWESQAIIRYLADAYTPHLYGPTPQARARVHQWMDWSQTSLQPAFMDLFWGLVRCPPAKQDARFVARSLAATNHALKLLDQHLSTQPYLAGDEFTIADIPAGTNLYRYYEMAGIERPTFAHVEAWYQRLRERPAYQQAVMVPFDDLVGKVTF